MYELYIESSAEKDLMRLPKAVFYRVAKKIQNLKENPRPQGCLKIVGSENDWRIRIGDYRVIYELNDIDKALIIMKVKHRKEAYN